MPAKVSRMHIVLGSAAVGRYPQGGGHWSWFLQYPRGLKALGHKVTWLEILPASGDRTRDRYTVAAFFDRVRELGLDLDCMAILAAEDQSLTSAEFHGASRERLAEIGREADMIWNLAAGARAPILSLFRKRVLVDVDPGHLQVASMAYNLDLDQHDVFLSVGARVGQSDCEVPTLGHRWRPFRPFVHLPDWTPAADPGIKAPFTSATHWTWEMLDFGDRYLSTSKRTAYLRYLEMPIRARRAFKLAVYIGPTDPTGERKLLESYGWEVADPHRVAPTPETYQEFIRGSRGEFQCPKPIYRELKTGWFSDRSVSYLAMGRPVLAEDTGFSSAIPCGHGLIAFDDLDSASAAVAEIDANYAIHSRAARELCAAYFDSRRCLSEMIAASFDRG